MPPNKPSKMSKAKSEDAAEGPPKGEEEQSQFMSIFWGVFKTLALLTLLYFFICSITFLEDAFKLVAGQSAGTVIYPICAINSIKNLEAGLKLNWHKIELKL